jgi:LPS O-antigen subunit length determinant protein (WzzB/FepE family)
VEKFDVRYEDEIDLKELINALLRKKKFIILITSAFTILSIAYAYLKTPIYEVKSNIKVGFIGKSLVEKPETIVKVLKIIYNVDEPLPSEKKFVSKVSNINYNKKVKDIITVKTEGISNDAALSLNKKVVTYLQNLYKLKIENYLNNMQYQMDLKKSEIYDLEHYEKQLLLDKINKVKTQEMKKIDEKILFYENVEKKAIKEKIKFHNEKLVEYENSINQIYENNKNNKDKVTGTISAMQILNYQNLILNSQNKIEDLKVRLEKIDKDIIPDLERQKKNIKIEKLKDLEHELYIGLPKKIKKLNADITDLKYKMSEQNVQNSKVVGNYFVRDYPVKPKKKLIVVVGFITGFMLSVFLVFMINYFKEDDNEIKAS